MGWIRDLLGKSGKAGAHRSNAKTKPAKTTTGRAAKITDLGRGKAFGGWDPNGRR